MENLKLEPDLYIVHADKKLGLANISINKQTPSTHALIDEFWPPLNPPGAPTTWVWETRIPIERLDTFINRAQSMNLTVASFVPF